MRLVNAGRVAPMVLGLTTTYPMDRRWNSLKKGGSVESMRLLAAIGWPWSGEPILIAGAPRTGTSWTAKALSLGRGVRYLREPVSHRGDLNGELSASYRYLLAGDDDPDYAAVWESAITEVTKGSRRWLLAETRPWLRRVPFWPARLLIKEVNCPLALEWLAEQFQMRIVVTIRHPCGYVASGLRVQEAGDPFVALEQMLSQPRLAAEYLSDDYDWLCQLDDPVARMAAGYAIIYRVLADQLAHHP